MHTAAALGLILPPLPELGSRANVFLAGRFPFRQSVTGLASKGAGFAVQAALPLGYSGAAGSRPGAAENVIPPQS